MQNAQRDTTNVAIKGPKWLTDAIYGCGNVEKTFNGFVIYSYFKTLHLQQLERMECSKLSIC